MHPKWKCCVCGKEIFDQGYICPECEDKLPYLNGVVCNHCGRKVIAYEEYCTTCKGILVSTDKVRSVFNYEKPISGMIKRAKYDDARYLLEMFAQKMTFVYYKNFMVADCCCYIPMTQTALKNRGYNQSQILAQKFAELVKIPVVECVVKKRETQRQATLTRAERLKNLSDVFKIVNKGRIKGKTVLIIDDVTTTGATAEAVAKKLKKAGALRVYLLTIASVPPIDKY